MTKQQDTKPDPRMTWESGDLEIIKGPTRSTQDQPKPLARAKTPPQPAKAPK